MRVDLDADVDAVVGVIICVIDARHVVVLDELNTNESFDGLSGHSLGDSLGA